MSAKMNGETAPQNRRSARSIGGQPLVRNDFFCGGTQRGQNIRGLPLIVEPRLFDNTAGADQNGDHGMRNLVPFAHIREPEGMSELREIGGGGNREVPLVESGGAIEISQGVAPQDRRGVVARIKTDAHEMRPFVETGLLFESRMDYRKMTGNEGAEIGKRAPGVDESDEERFAAELAQANGPVFLVHEWDIGDGIARGKKPDDRRWRNPAAKAGVENFEILEPAIVGGIGDEEIGGYDVSDLDLAKTFRVPNGVGHGHGGHKTGDVVVLEGNFFGGRILGNDAAPQLVLVVVMRAPAAGGPNQKQGTQDYAPKPGRPRKAI